MLDDLRIVERKKSVASLLLFILKHPKFGMRILPHIRITRENEKSNGPSWLEDVKSDSEPSRAYDEKAIQDVIDTLAQAELSIVKQQTISVVERAIDAQLFGGRDRDDDRFVRLKLRNSYHNFRVPDTEEVQYIVFEPRLLMHESGVVQLSLRLETKGPLTTEQTLSLMWGPEPRIVRSEISTPLLSGSGWEPFVKEFEEKLDMGKSLGVIDHECPASISEILGGHLNAVLKVLGHSSDSWSNYPVAIIQPGDCCESEGWKENHASEIHRLAIRGRGVRQIAPHVAPPTDLSMDSDHSLFVSLGSATYIQWKGDMPEGLDELHTVLLFEHALLIYMRLQTMEDNVAGLTTGERKLHNRYRDAIFLLSELRQGNLSAGEARDIVSYLLKELGADKIRPTIETALNLAGMAHSTETAARTARRSWEITILATVIAILVAVPSLWQLLDTALDNPPQQGPDWLLFPLQWAASFEFWGPWVLLLTCIGGILVLKLLSWKPRRHRRRLQSRRRGYAWPAIFSVEYRNSDSGGPGSS